MLKTSTASKAALVVAIAAIAAYWYWSPYLTVWQLQSAAQSRDADAFNRHVDYPKLRESLKGQFSAMFAGKLGEPSNDLAKAGSALGTLLGMALVSPLVDAVVRPEIMMRALEEGYLSPKVVPAVEAPARAGSEASASADGRDTPPAVQKEPDAPKWTYRRDGANRVVAYANDAKKPDQPDRDKLALVLARSGFANWKLADLRLPALNK
jgi:hypothetical protein